MRTFFLVLFLGLVAAVSFFGLRGRTSPKPPIEIFPDMDRQAKVKAQKPSAFFADGRAARPPVPGTVPMGYEIPAQAGGVEPAQVAAEIRSPFGVYSAGDDYFHSGKVGEFWGDGIPFEVTPDVLARGRARYEISCAVCHGQSGQGNGIVGKYGFTGVIANLHQDRLQAMPDGEIFNTITHGKNLMMAYGDKVAVEDRWAIITWVRALQRSQRATLADVPPEERANLETP